MSRTGGDPAVSLLPPRREPVAEARRSYLFRFAAAGAGLLSTLVTTILVVRVLGANAAAVYLSIMAALFVGPMIGRLGLGPNAMRLIAADAHDERTAATHLAATGLLSTVSAPIVAYVATFAVDTQSTRVLIIAMTTALIILESLRLTVSDMFAALGLVGLSVLTTHHFRSLLTVLGLLGYLAVAQHATLVGVLSVTLVVALLTFVASLRPLARHVNPFARPEGLQPITRAIGAGIVLFVVEFAGFLVARGDVWLASSAFSDVDAARYGAASVVGYQVTVPLALAAIALSPVIARLWARGRQEELRRLIDAISTMAVAITVPLVLLLWAVGRPLMALGYGDQYRPAGTLLAILGTGTVVAAATSISPALLMMTGKSRPAALTVLVALAVVIPVGVVAAYLGGPTALAVTSSSATALVALALWICSRVTLGFAATPRLGVRSAVRLFRGSQVVPGQELA